MLLVSHRGNISGPNKHKENLPVHLDSLIRSNISIEIDLWVIKGELFLGHDSPTYHIPPNYLSYPGFWIHAKNAEALFWLKYTSYNYFWHQTDDFTLTSHNYIWTFPEKKVSSQSIIVCRTPQEVKKYKKLDIYGVCSDYIEA